MFERNWVIVLVLIWFVFTPSAQAAQWTQQDVIVYSPSTRTLTEDDMTYSVPPAYEPTYGELTLTGSSTVYFDKFSQYQNGRLQSAIFYYNAYGNGFTNVEVIPGDSSSVGNCEYTIFLKASSDELGYVSYSGDENDLGFATPPNGIYATYESYSWNVSGSYSDAYSFSFGTTSDIEVACSTQDCLVADGEPLLIDFSLDATDTLWVGEYASRTVLPDIEVSATIQGIQLNAFLTYVYDHPGDVNCDDQVGAGDLGILAGNMGMTSGATWEMGDLNGDGAVSAGDLGILAGNWGWSAEPPASIPEPISLTLALPLAALGVLRRRNSRR